ncbi:MAG TPA: AAA family ATPase, partial [Solirubrobacter sp.]|nr:AAA family ATPase [Solirubrobacter sp.]
MAAGKATLLGRRQELAALDDVLTALERRRGAVIAFSGEGGIGKTRLLDELGDRARARGHLVLYGRASELERELPFGVWEDALAEHAEFLGVDRLERLVGDQLPELAAVLPTVGAVPAGLQDERYRTHRAVRALLEAIAQRQGVVVTLDDLQWADDASLELVAHLLRRAPRGRVALALAFRPAPVRPLLATALAGAERDGTVIEYALGALSFADAEALLGADVPAPVRGEIYEAGGGNPFFLQQLARQHAAGRSVAAEPSGGAVPRAVARALEQEIAALGDDGRLLAQGAAVAGDPVDLDLAMAAGALDEERALPALDELLAGALLVSTDVPRRYRFRHPLVRLAIYESAAEGWRIAAHSRAAAALAERGGSLAARAHHLERCARPGDDEALEVLIEAGRHAAARAPATAADRFAAALRLIPETEESAPRRLELLVGLSQALAATGRLEEALAALNDGLALVGPELAPVRARLVAACAMCENLLGRHAAAHARLLGALDEIGDERSFAAADLEIELAADALYDTDFAGAVDWARRARAAADEIGMPSFIAVATAVECFGAIGQGRIEEAQRLREDAAARLDALDDGALAGRLDAAYYLGFGEFFCECYDDAIRHFKRGIAVSRASGQGQFVIVMTVGLAYACEVRGRLAEAAEHADAAVEAARLLGNDQMLCFALTADAWVSAQRGSISRSRASGAEAMAIVDRLDESVLSRSTRVTVASAQFEAGEPENCLEAMSAGGAPEFANVEPGRRAWLYAVLARAELALGRPAAARDWVERGEADVDGLGLPYAEAAVLCARAQLDGAVEPAVRAAELADSVGAVIQAARARTLAGSLIEDDATAIPLLERAESDLGGYGAL